METRCTPEPDSRERDRTRAADPAPAGAANRSARTRAAESAARTPYTAPRLERLGAWSALTLQQSIPIGPGSFGV